MALGVKASAPFPRLLVGSPDAQQVVTAYNEVVEYLEAQPILETSEKPLQVVAYPMKVLTRTRFPIALLINAWMRDTEKTFHATSVHWYRGIAPVGWEGSQLIVTGIDGLTAGAERRLTFVVVGKAVR